MSFWKSLMTKEKDANFVYLEDINNKTPEDFFQWFFGIDKYLRSNNFISDHTKYDGLLKLIKKHEKVERIVVTGWLIQNIAILPTDESDSEFGELLYDLEGEDFTVAYFKTIKESLSHLPAYYFKDAVISITKNKELYDEEIFKEAKRMIKDYKKIAA